MRYLFIATLTFALISCKRNRLTTYSYNDITITRIDKDASTNFYYGDFRNSDTLPKSYIQAKYSGFNYVMSSLVTFHKDKRITFVDMGDGLEQIGSPKLMKILSYSDNLKFSKMWDKIKLNYDSIVQIDDVIKREKELNKGNNSKVVAIYSTDE